MRYMARVAAGVVLALGLCQSAMAAPSHGAFMATSHSSNRGLFDHFLGLFGAIWGDKGAIWGDKGAIWGNHGAIWGNDSSTPASTNGSKGSKATTTEGAIWGRCISNCP